MNNNMANNIRSSPDKRTNLMAKRSQKLKAQPATALKQFGMTTSESNMNDVRQQRAPAQHVSLPGIQNHNSRTNNFQP